MYANAKQILANHCISRNRNEYQIIACQFISLLLGGNGNKNENFALASTSLQLDQLHIIVSRAYEHGINC